jgi:hypothetical protein
MRKKTEACPCCKHEHCPTCGNCETCQPKMITAPYQPWYPYIPWYQPAYPRWTHWGGSGTSIANGVTVTYGGDSAGPPLTSGNIMLNSGGQS